MWGAAIDGGGLAARIKRISAGGPAPRLSRRRATAAAALCGLALAVFGACRLERGAESRPRPAQHERDRKALCGGTDEESRRGGSAPRRGQGHDATAGCAEGGESQGQSPGPAPAQPTDALLRIPFRRQRPELVDPVVHRAPAWRQSMGVEHQPRMGPRRVRTREAPMAGEREGTGRHGRDLRPCRASCKAPTTR